MVFSPLIAGTLPHHGKYSSRQGQPIVRVLQHHWAGVGGGDARLLDPNQQASSNYIIYSDGRIFGQVPEEFRAWTSGSFAADAPAITYEVQNTAGAVNGNDDDPGSWPVSTAAYNAIIQLTSDIARRYGWGAVSDGNYQGHRQWFQTACPGGFLWSRMAQTRQLSNNLLLGGNTVKPAPATPPVKGKTVWQLADEVIAGLHGSGAQRQASLGANYAAVQAEVNRRLGAPKAALPKVKTIAQLADEVIAGVHGSGDARVRSLGSNYAAVQNEVNRRLGPAKAPKALSIAQMADKVLRGDYGHGDARVKALGSNYAAVQAEVNRRLGAKVPPKRKAPSISQLADAVIRGEYGNGADRQRRLGANYAAVQAEINRRYS